MWYRKNVPGWERIVRIIAAAGMVACGLIGLAIGYLVAAVGVFVGVTGFIGFCPACVMVGRNFRCRNDVAGE